MSSIQTNIPSALLSDAAPMALCQRPSPALTLPGDLLIEICRTILQTTKTREQSCRLDTIEDLDADRTRGSIMSISQVCRIWRNIVTQCPDLWCHFFNPHHRAPEWIHLVLERSKPYGITLYKPPPFFMDGQYQLELFKELTYADRLTSYSIALRMDCKIWYDEGVPIDWPQLRYLCICHFQYYEWESAFDPTFDENFLLPADFPSAESTPRLERLHLHSCALQGVSQVTGLSKLTELRVSGNRVWSIPQCVEIFQSLHHLKRLSLDNVIAAPNPVASILGVRNDMNPKQMFTMELEECFLRDDCGACAQFFEHITLTASRIFHLRCHNASWISWPEEHYHLLVWPRIAPIIDNLLKTNPHFASCKLQVDHDLIQCQGVPDHYDWETVPRPEVAGCGGSFFDGTYIEVCFENESSCEKMFGEWFHSILGNVVQLNVIDDENIAFQEDYWLSKLLRKSSHRLKALHGLTSNAWIIVLRNMFPELHGFEPPCLPDIPFLSELEELGMYVLESPDDYPFYQSIFDFCDRKNAMGKPLLKFRDPPPLWEAESDPDRVAFKERLEAIGIRVVDNFSHRGVRMMIFEE